MMIFTLEGFIAFLTLTFLELVLGIDNLLFISILSNKLPKEKRKKTRTIGLLFAMFFRIILLLGITWLTRLSKPLFSLGEYDFSVRELIFIAGGLFLIYKSSVEIFQNVEKEEKVSARKVFSSIVKVIIQIILIDLIFSFDSILTAIGMTEDTLIICLAISVSIIVMIFFSEIVSKMILKFPSLQVIALAFLIMIGTFLIMEGFHVHVDKKYLYFALFFSISIEYIKIRNKIGTKR